MSIVVALASGLAFAGVSVAGAQPSPPGGSASISYPPGEQSSPGSNTLIVPNGTGSVTVAWEANCPPYSGDSDPQDWSWSITINGTYSDGHDAFDSGYIGPTLGVTSASGNQTFAVSFEHATDTSETIAWVAQLHCGSALTLETLGSGSFTLERCDPDDFDTALHEYETADKFAEAGLKDLEEAYELDGEIDQEANDEAAKTIVYGEGLGELLAALEHGAELTPQEALAAELAHLTNELLNWAENAALESQDWARLTNGAAADFEHANQLWDDANQRLNRALAGRCPDAIHNQIKKLLDDQELDDRAQEIIKSWDHNENETLYTNPVTHEAEQVDLALKQVKAELTAGQQEADVAGRGARASRGVKLTVKEVRAAIHYLKTAQGRNRTLEAQLARIQSADETAIKGLRALF